MRSTALRRRCAASGGALLLISACAALAQQDEADAPPGYALPSTPLGGRTLFVSPAGNDANPGTRVEPWATPGHASRKLEPGDTLVILGGRYVLSRYDEDILKPPSGREDAWICIRGEEGHRPVLAGRDNLLCAMELSGVSHVRIENLEFTHDTEAQGEALRFRDVILIVEKPSHHLQLIDLHIHHVDEFGLNFQDVSHLDVIGCRIEYCGSGAIGGPEGAAGGWRDARILGCSLSYCGHYYQGTDGENRPYDRPDGFGIEPGQGPVEIAYTVAQHNRGDGLDSKAERTHIHHCRVTNNSCDGIKVWGDGSKIENCLVYGTGDGGGREDPWAGIVIDCVEKAGSRFEVVNTTIHDDVRRHACPMYVQTSSPVPVSLTMTNCIVAGGNHGLALGENVTFRSSHCCFYCPSEDEQVMKGDDYWTAETIARLGTGNIAADPRFRRPAWGQEGDYRLQDDSPCRGAGTPQGAPETDLDGNPRPRDTAPDMGAFQQ